MNEFINVLHLTDLHFGMEPGPKVSPTAAAQRSNALKPLIARVAGLKREWRPTIVAISGDIGWKGAASDYDSAKHFLTDLLTALGLQPDRLIMCAGNHDINRNAAADVLPPSKSGEADKLLEVENLANMERPFAAFETFSEKFGLEKLRIGNTDSRIIGQRDLLALRFVVLNSAWFCRGDEDKGKLWIGLKHLQVMQAERQLANEDPDTGPITIGLLHHPTQDLSNEENYAYGNRPSTYSYLARRTHLLLSGHTHGAVEKATHYNQGAFVIVGGASYAGEGYRNNFSIIRIGLKDRAVFRLAFEFDPRDETWKDIDHEEDFSLRRRAFRLPPVPISTVRFDDERTPNEIELQRAIHVIRQRRPISADVVVPLIYDEHVVSLKARQERRYENFEEELQAAGYKPTAYGFNTLHSAIDYAIPVMEDLPRKLALFADMIEQCSIFRGSSDLSRRACSRFVQLTMTSVLAQLATCQLGKDDPLYFKEYWGFYGFDGCVARIDGIGIEAIVTYLLVSATHEQEQRVFAPRNYNGRPWALQPREWEGGSFHLPTAFLTDYLFPQIALANWWQTENWRFSALVDEVYVKNRAGEYIQ
jgi:predicted MPP superfamily phosphohydrolase